MASDLDGDLGVDVLIIGGGIQGLYLARALHKQYSVCILSDPHAPSETLDSPGYFSAGYNGNDVARIQPARRAAGYWRLWAESNGVPHHEVPPYYVMSNDEEGTRTRLWSDATLKSSVAPDVPPIFGRGSLVGQAAYLAENDVVMNPTDVVAKLREGLEDHIIQGEVRKFGIITDKAVDFVEVETMDGRAVPITPRFLLLAANVGNGALLQKLVATFKDRGKRKEAVDTMRGCQAVRRRTTVVARGDLPLVAGHFDGLDIVAHYVGTGTYVWLISPPIDDGQTVLGPEEVRFSPKLDHDVVSRTVDQLFQVAPLLKDKAGSLEWGAYVARKTEHPMMATPDTSKIAQPAPARLETLDMEGFIAAWPSHLSYAMIVGDVVAEKVQNALGPAGDFTDGPQLSDFASVPEEQVARWEKSSFEWHRWPDFQTLMGIHD